MREFENFKILAIEKGRGGTLCDLMKTRMREGKPLQDEECAVIIKAIC